MEKEKIFHIDNLFNIIRVLSGNSPGIERSKPGINTHASFRKFGTAYMEKADETDFNGLDTDNV